MSDQHASAGAGGLERDPLFVALTRPQMFAGVAYSYFVANMVIGIELFLLFHSVWVLAVMAIFHATGVVMSARDPRTFDLWLVRIGRCPRIRNRVIWRCNSYRP